MPHEQYLHVHKNSNTWNGMIAGSVRAISWLSRAVRFINLVAIQVGWRNLVAIQVSFKTFISNLAPTQGVFLTKVAILHSTQLLFIDVKSGAIILIMSQLCQIMSQLCQLCQLHILVNYVWQCGLSAWIMSAGKNVTRDKPNLCSSKAPQCSASWWKGYKERPSILDWQIQIEGWDTWLAGGRNNQKTDQLV